MTILFIISAILITVGVGEFATQVVLGGLLSDKEHLAYVERILKNKKLSTRNPSILSSNTESDFITEQKTSVLSYYYIQGVGRIPRWSKMHKLIKAKFKELQSEYFKS